MKLTKEQVQHVARLARLSLTDNEVEKFGKELSGILNYVDMLQEVDTDGIEPTAQVTGLENIFEDDAVNKCEFADALLQCSPLPLEKRQIRVKSVF